MQDNLPTMKELSDLIQELATTIGDDYRSDGCDTPTMDLTIGWDPKTGEKGYQTGDNSFTGGAYLYPIWAVTVLDRDCEKAEIANGRASDLIEELSEQANKEACEEFIGATLLPLA